MSDEQKIQETTSPTDKSALASPSHGNRWKRFMTALLSKASSTNTYTLAPIERIQFVVGLVFAFLTIALIWTLCCNLWSGNLIDQPVGREFHRVVHAQHGNKKKTHESHAMPTSTETSSCKAIVVNNFIRWSALAAITGIAAWTSVKLLRDD